MNLDDIVEKRIRESNDLERQSEILSILLSGGYSVWEDGSLLCNRQLVDFQKGLKIEIYPNEHPPPHFHVKSGNANVSFSIEKCELLEGKLNGRDIALIKWWHKRSKKQLIDIWNKTRPSDCPVGKIISS